ncbi:MAG TPA: FAD-dependent oxidoreductase [Myxococcaceae bacterium]|nr:FAD-dependent oxidoreductase [Myxococcaceae bacterium]
MTEVTVVGAGVVGLTTAIALQHAGHRVQVIAAERPERTTSAAAGAVWYPFGVGPPARVNRWARATRAWLVELAATVPRAGVDLLTVLECASDGRRPWWADAVEGLRFVEAPQPSGARCGWEFEAPRVEPALHLPWLESQLERPIEIARIARLDDVPGEVVVNCTGIGARRLTGDGTLSALLGQTVLVAPGEVDLRRIYGDERDLSAMLYVIPRRRTLVIGGCALPFDGDVPPPPDPSLRAAFLERARAAGVRHGPVLGDAVGLRPFRPEVRVERVGRVIHHYGHGGAGYTLGWGSAADVSAMVSQAGACPPPAGGRVPSP